MVMDTGDTPLQLIMDTEDMRLQHILETMVTAIEDTHTADTAFPDTVVDSPDSDLAVAWDGEEEGEAAEGAGGKPE